MRLSEKLDSYLTPYWRKQYFGYDELKDMLVEAMDDKLINDNNVNNMTSSAFRYYFLHFDEKFFLRCELELNKINNFYMEKLAEGKRKYEFLRRTVEKHISSDKDIVNSMISKPKLELIKAAFSKLYLSLVLLQNYQVFNYMAIRRICKKHDRIWNVETGQKWFTTYVDIAYLNTDAYLMNLIREMETYFINILESGNRMHAMNRLRTPSLMSIDKQRPTNIFLLGINIGIFVVLVLVAMVKLNLEGLITGNMITICKLYRGHCLIAMFLLLLSLNVYGWRKVGINHVLIFRIDPRDHLVAVEIMNIAMMLALFTALSIVAMLFSQLIALPSYLQPLLLSIIMLGFLMNPLHICFYSSRIWLLKCLGRIILAPSFPISFADFWLAEQIVSLWPFLLDCKFIVIFYCFNDDWYKWLKEPLPFTMDQYFVTPIIRCLPAWFRFAQCIRRYWDTRQIFPFMVNAIKYSSTFLVVGFSTLMMYYEDWYKTTFRNPYVWAYLVSEIISAVYYFTWDMLMDFGVFAKFSGENIFIRNNILYKPNFYYLGICMNFFLRFFWAIAFLWNQNKMLAPFYIETISGILEMFRRFLWNFFRLENEHLYNAGQFRDVCDISISPMFPQDEIALQRMMDEIDGVVNRHKKVEINKLTSFTKYD